MTLNTITHQLTLEVFRSSLCRSGNKVVPGL